MSDGSTVSLLRLLQLASPALPIGAYAYSHGLEQAVTRGWVHDRASAESWIEGVLTHALARLDLPVLARIYLALARGDEESAERWDGLLRATRATRELALEDRQLSLAFARVLADLDVAGAARLRLAPRSFARVFAHGCLHYGIEHDACLSAFAFSFVENQVSAAIKLVPLGQRAGQQILARVALVVASAVESASSLRDDEIGELSMGLALASSLHETQYARLFRS